MKTLKGRALMLSLAGVLALGALGEAQALPMGSLFARARANHATVTQSGTNQGAAVRQTGEGNVGGVTQYGRNNTGVVTQNGSNNNACLAQLGHNLDGSITQTGDNLNAGVVQTNHGVGRISPAYCQTGSAQSAILHFAAPFFK